MAPQSLVSGLVVPDNFKGVLNFIGKFVRVEKRGIDYRGGKKGKKGVKKGQVKEEKDGDGEGEGKPPSRVGHARHDSAVAKTRLEAMESMANLLMEVKKVVGFDMAILTAIADAAVVKAENDAAATDAKVKELEKAIEGGEGGGE